MEYDRIVHLHLNSHSGVLQCALCSVQCALCISAFLVSWIPLQCVCVCLCAYMFVCAVPLSSLVVQQTLREQLLVALSGAFPTLCPGGEQPPLVVSWDYLWVLMTCQSSPRRCRRVSFCVSFFLHSKSEKKKKQNNSDCWLDLLWSSFTFVGGGESNLGSGFAAVVGSGVLNTAGAE